MRTLKIGDKAPAFSLPRDGGDLVNLADFAGRQVVLYFYPRDDTSGCTKEATGFTQAVTDFAKSNTVVLGVSKDPVKKHEKFVSKHALGIALLSDETTDLCETYGVWVEKSMYGKTFMGIERATFLIGTDGKIVQIWRKVKVAGHVEVVLAAARVI
ncbi:thioredoxin-dependent thiol peroxidase [Yoonia sp. MH D7]